MDGSLTEYALLCTFLLTNVPGLLWQPSQGSHSDSSKLHTVYPGQAMLGAPGHRVRDRIKHDRYATGAGQSETRGVEWPVSSFLNPPPLPPVMSQGPRPTNPNWKPRSQVTTYHTGNYPVIAPPPPRAPPKDC